MSIVKDMNDSYKLNAIVRKYVSRPKIEKILVMSAKRVQTDIQSLAPVDTGTYRESIKIDDVKYDGNKSTIKIYSDLNSGWKGVALGHLLEWGTGVQGEKTNKIDHGFPYRQTPWCYYNERYGRWIFTNGNIARPHFYPGLKLNERDFINRIISEVCKK